MDVKLSNRIRILSLVCTIFVVYRHAYTVPAFFDESEVPFYLVKTREVLSRITSLAVPMFFIISGFFFFKHNYYSRYNYSSMILKKFRTLFVPFIIWNVVGGLALYLEHSPLLGMDLKTMLLNLLQSHWYGPLWYVRDLMIWMLLYPIYGWLVNSRCHLFLLLLISCAFYYWVPVASNVMAMEGLLFFLIGGWLSNHNSLVAYHIHKWIYGGLALLWFIWSFCTPLLSDMTYYKLYVFLGIIILWQTILRFTFQEKTMLELSHYSFFLYVTHIYVLKVFKVLAASLFYGNGQMALLVYIFGPILSIFIIYHLGKFCKTHLDKIYLLAVGGR